MYIICFNFGSAKMPFCLLSLVNLFHSTWFQVFSFSFLLFGVQYNHLQPTSKLVLLAQMKICSDRGKSKAEESFTKKRDG